MAELIVGVIAIVLIIVIGISVSQINGNIKRLVNIQTELLNRMERPVNKTVDKFDPQTGEPL